MKTLAIIIVCLILTVILAANSDYKNVRRVEIVKTNPNRVIKSTYDVKNNIFAVLYVENNDTVGLDWIHPYELDSLINDLNKQNQ